ncbi:MAG TPA: hypothetical protein VJG67_01480 [Candidatus Paceibacterota bacterium]
MMLGMLFVAYLLSKNDARSTGRGLEGQVSKLATLVKNFLLTGAVPLSHFVYKTLKVLRGSASHPELACRNATWLRLFKSGQN